jgi:hypothetical protein
MTNTWKIIVNGLQLRLVNNLISGTKLYINGKSANLKLKVTENRENYSVSLDKLGDIVISKITSTIGQELRMYVKQNGCQKLILSRQLAH